MPTYEYRCQSCDHQFEIFARMSDPDPDSCPDCGAVGALQKVLFPVAVHYKGSGFYSTDYSGAKSSSGAAGSGGESTSGSDAGGSSSDAGGSTSTSGSDSGSSSSGGDSAASSNSASAPD